MHMPEGLWNSAVGHDDGDLMECLWKKSPEVPVILSAPQTGAGIALDSVVEVREAERIAEEKDWSIVSDDVPISLFSVELESKAADIALRIGCPAFPSDARKAREHRRLLSDLRKNRCLGVLGDVVRCRERPMRPPAFGMHPALRNDLAIKVGELLDRKSTRLNSSHQIISYAVFSLKKKKAHPGQPPQRTCLASQPRASRLAV